MYVFRGLGETDPWASTAPDETSSPGLIDSVIGTLKSLPLIAPNTPQVSPAIPGTTPTAQAVTAPKTPWYKTPLGIGGILLAGFLGYRYYKSKK